MIKKYSPFSAPHKLFKLAILAGALAGLAACASTPPNPAPMPYPPGPVTGGPATGAKGVLVMPVNFKVKTSAYGPRRNSFHHGVDLAAHKGTPVRAAANGVVSFSGWKSGYGKTIIIDHKNGLQTYYAHLNHIHVKKGARTKAGIAIGTVGRTGNASGPNLHFETREHGKSVNPTKYLNFGGEHPH
jgi:murein DD-endopeptidase MepM/ murein hydrolase activator NlpD